MQWSDIHFAPPVKTLRQFALLWLLFFGSLACWQGLVQENGPWALGFAIAALTLGLLGLVWPQAVRPVFVGWMVLAFPVGWCVSRVILACLFFGVFTPVALLFKLLGRDALRLRPAPATASYWTAKPQTTAVR